MQGGEGAGRALGLFINTLPVRIRIGEDTVEATVIGTHRLLTQLLRHEHTPLAVAQRCSRVTAPAPLFTALLNYRHGVAAEQMQTRKAWEGIELLGGGGLTSYPIVLSVDDLDEQLTLVAQALAPADHERELLI